MGENHNTTIQETIRVSIIETVDSFNDSITDLAKICVEVFGEKGKNQMSNLERQGLTARYFGDIVSYVKRQTGKDSNRENWAKYLGTSTISGVCLGEGLVSFLEDIRNKADSKADEEKLVDKVDKNELRLKLAGICLRNLSSEFLYRKMMKG